MKKVISLFLLSALIIGCLTSCAPKPLSMTATVEGSIFGGMSDDKIPVSVKFDTRWLTKEDNQVCNPDLAQFCALLSADSYFREKDYDKQRQNRVLFDKFNEPDYEFTSFLKNVGFTEAEHYESYLSQEDPTDSNDSVTVNIGHQTVDEKYDVYAVVIRGCFSAQEWCSAFDPGCESEAYQELTGEHPEWKNKDHFKGLDVAANRALAYINSYIEKTGDDALEDRILITGHSRGGGIANILGAYFEKETQATTYTYTFNTPGVTLSADTKDYKTIFNIFDSGDFFTEQFPFAEGTFSRYGTDMTACVSESEQLRSSIAALKGRDDYTCVPSEAAEEYRSLFAKKFPNRNMLCDKEAIIREFASADEAEKAREECLAIIGSEAGLGLEDLCSVSEVADSNGEYSFTIEYCGAALLRTYAMTLAYGEAAYKAAISLFAEDKDACKLASILMENSLGVNGGHLLINSYEIAGSLK